jgi:non-heme chloroperoxidase
MQQQVPQLRFATTRLGSGPRVHYAEQGDPGGAPIVFLPAYTDSWFSYSRVLPLLPARYHAYALDQRGHGDSERPACCYAVEDFAGDVVAFLDAVGIERASLVGHSGSGLNDPVPVQFARELQGAAAHVTLPEAFFERLVAESLKLPARVWKSALDGLFAFDDASDLGRIAAPTLLIWGEWDRWLPREEEDQLAARIPGARVMVYPETGHSPNWERPERVAADLDAFMRQG